MTPEMEKLAAVANKALDYAESLEKRPLAKTASAKTVADTVDKLIKVGAFSEEQRARATQLFMDDPNAAFRCIDSILDGQALGKKAAEDLSVGRIVDADNTAAREDRTLSRMRAHLNGRP